MRAIGFRADPSTIYWAVVDGPNAPLVLVASGKLPAPATYVEAASLGWYRTEVRNLIDQYQPQKIAVRYPEPSARPGKVTSAHRRVRIEGVILEAAHSKGIEVLTGALVTIKSQLKTDSPKAYIGTGQFRGLDCSRLTTNSREAVLMAATALGGTC
jgi:Holliday junction resolvasome RuvABC endonuclease subunit